MKSKKIIFLAGLLIAGLAAYNLDSFFGTKTPARGTTKNLWVELSPDDVKKDLIQIPSLAPLIKRVEDAVLVVTTEAIIKQPQMQLPPGMEQGPFKDFFRFFGQPNDQEDRKAKGQGSGFIIHPSGYALTNNHVIENATKITVKVGASQQEYEAEVVGTDVNTDVALIKIKGTRNDWPVIPLGDSDQVLVGDWAIAIGNPLGLELSASHGMISARGRRDVNPSGRQGLYDFIQIDAPINFGNSGGPLLNLAGEVIGINTAISAQGQGIAFAIPIKQVKNILGQLKENGKATRSWLGLKIQKVGSELAKEMGLSFPHGALVHEVVKDSPAAKAGIKAGDIVTQFNNKVVEDPSSLSFMAGLAAAKQSIPVTFYRNKKAQTVMVLLEEMPSETPDTGVAPAEKGSATKIKDLGIAVTTLTKEWQKKLKIDEELLGGAVISELSPGSPVRIYGIQQYDVVISLNDVPVKSAEEFANAYGKLKNGQFVKLLMKRGNTTIFTAFAKSLDVE